MAAGIGAGHATPAPAITTERKIASRFPSWIVKMAADILRQLHYPVTTGNIEALLAWHQAEGGSASFNIFNTTQPAAGASNYNSVGVKNYVSYQQGLSATVATLRNGYYPEILAALKANNPYGVAQGLENEPWGTSGSLVASILHGWGIAGGGAPDPSAGSGGGSSLPGDPIGAIKGAIGDVGSAASATEKLADPNFWLGLLLRAAFIGAGLVLVVVGVLRLFGQSPSSAAMLAASKGTTAAEVAAV